MTRSFRAPFHALVVVAAATATLAACHRREDPPTPAAPGADPAVQQTPAEAAAPLGYDSKNRFAEVKLTLPEAIKAQPDLHARLYAASVRDLKAFVEGAQGDRSEAGGADELPPYEKSLTFSTAGETARLFSLKEVDFDYSGGAHPNTTASGVLWDKALKRQLGVADLFRAGADASALDRALCDAINTAKKARNSTTPPSTLGGKDWSCPKALSTAFVLTPGTVPGKAGGLTFLIGPYQVGPYSDGAYEIALPQSVFRSLLNPAYADEFAGQPVKAGDVSPAR